MKTRTNTITALSPQQMTWLFVVFYSVGIVLFAFPHTRTIFLWTTPYSLILVSAATLIFEKHFNKKFISMFLTIAILSIIVEIVGVATGAIFGAYQYGNTLGISVAGVPLLIGLNWLILIYSTHSISSSLFQSPLVKIVSAALLMVLYDIVIEYVAPQIAMWKFEGGYPPFQNFLGWFVLSLIFHSLIYFFKMRITNPVARILYFSQLLFFIILTLITYFHTV